MSEPMRYEWPACDCGVSLGIRTNHEGECAGAYLRTLCRREGCTTPVRHKAAVLCQEHKDEQMTSIKRSLAGIEAKIAAGVPVKGKPSLGLPRDLLEGRGGSYESARAGEA